MPDSTDEPTAIRLERIEIDNRSIRERLHEFSNQLQSIALGVSDIQHGMKDQDKSLDGLSRGHERLDHAINGNGKPGLKALVEKVESRLDNHDRWIGVWNKMLLVFGTSLVGLTVAALWKVITMTSR